MEHGQAPLPLAQIRGAEIRLQLGGRDAFGDERLVGGGRARDVARQVRSVGIGEELRSGRLGGCE